MTVESTTWLLLDRKAGDLEGQIHHAFRERVLDGRLSAGDRLPSSRALAAVLGVARSTVVHAYERLSAEGFIAAARGSSTRIATLPASPQRPGEAVAPPRLPEPEPEPDRSLPFRPGLPDLSAFPARIWARCLAGQARFRRGKVLGYGEETGLKELRAAILSHVRERRGVLAHADQVIILPSAAAAIDLLARLTLRPDADVAWIEEPGYRTAQKILQGAGAHLVPVPCDGDGIDPGRARGPPPRLIYVTPSHQYPTGVAMSLPRRLALLERAAAEGAVVVEDDYDSEYHYAARPLAALQGIDRTGCVAYVGTFSKVMAPGLKVAYAIVPASLLASARTHLRLHGNTVPIHVQAALADFLNEGHLRAHIRKMRGLYAERMAVTARALGEECGSRLEIGGGDGGLQLAAFFRDERRCDQTVARALHAQGLGAVALSDFHLGKSRPGLLFGIAGATPERAARLANILRVILTT
jgi:GntR family transcriptional regulator/MocR family aminotransferase